MNTHYIDGLVASKTHENKINPFLVFVVLK